MDRKKILTIGVACLVVFGTAAAGVFLMSFAISCKSATAVEGASRIDSTIAWVIDTNLSAIESLQEQLSSVQPHQVTLPNLAHAIGAFGSSHEVSLNGKKVRTVQWLLEEASHQELIGGQPAVAQGRTGWQFRRPQRLAEYGIYEGHMAQVLFYLSDSIENPDAMNVRLPIGETVSLRSFVVSLEREMHGIGIETSYALPVLFRWSSPAGWSNRFGEHWNAARLVELHLEREPFEHFCGGAHWCYALAFAIRGEHQQRLPASILRTANARLDELLSEVIESIDDHGEIHWPLQAEGSAVSRQAHTLEWVLLAAHRELLKETLALHLAIEWLVLQTESQFDTLSFRDFAHIARALRSYLELVGSLTSDEP